MPARLFLAFAAVYLVWGSTYLAIRFAVETLPPLLMAGARFVIAGAILLLWARLREGFRGPSRREWITGSLWVNAVKISRAPSSRSAAMSLSTGAFARGAASSTSWRAMEASWCLSR